MSSKVAVVGGASWAPEIGEGRAAWGMGDSRGLGKRRGGRPRRAGGDGGGAAAAAEAGREGPGGLPCGALAAATPWPGSADPGGGRAWPAGRPGDAALVARAARGCEAPLVRRRGGGAGRSGARPGGGARGGPGPGAGTGHWRRQPGGSSGECWGQGSDTASREGLVPARGLSVKRQGH